MVGRFPTPRLCVGIGQRQGHCAALRVPAARPCGPPLTLPDPDLGWQRSGKCPGVVDVGGGLLFAGVADSWGVVPVL